jgi:hypothetical protein
MKAPALVCVLALLAASTPAAEPKKPKPSFKDPLDGKFDMSDRIIESGAFVPVPILITESALGSFGGGMAPVFIDRNAPVERDGKQVPTLPNITAGAGAYTANDSWFLGAGRVASLPKHGIRYVVGAGYGDINLDFYETLPSGEAKAFGVNSRGSALLARVMKQVVDHRFSLGVQYALGSLKLRPLQSGELPPAATELSLDSKVSTAALVAEFDGRDNIFTPDRGVKLHGQFSWSDEWLGSNYKYGRVNSYVYGYAPLGRWSEDRGWIAAFRVDWQQVVDEPPFYLLPSIDMRGIPALRYQGRTNLLAETEQRIDFTRRWSVVLFGGLGKAFDDYSDFGDAELVYGYGSGFRYLVARKFKLRMGIDLAHGPEKWAYYIVFGTAWKR